MAKRTRGWSNVSLADLKRFRGQLAALVVMAGVGRAVAEWAADENATIGAAS